MIATRAEWSNCNTDAAIMMIIQTNSRPQATQQVIPGLESMSLFKDSIINLSAAFLLSPSPQCSFIHSARVQGPLLCPPDWAIRGRGRAGRSWPYGFTEWPHCLSDPWLALCTAATSFALITLAVSSSFFFFNFFYISFRWHWPSSCLSNTHIFLPQDLYICWFNWLFPIVQVPARISPPN